MFPFNAVRNLRTNILPSTYLTLLLSKWQDIYSLYISQCVTVKIGLYMLCIVPFVFFTCSLFPTFLPSFPSSYLPSYLHTFFRSFLDAVCFFCMFCLFVACLRVLCLRFLWDKLPYRLMYRSVHFRNFSPYFLFVVRLMTLSVTETQ